MKKFCLSLMLCLPTLVSAQSYYPVRDRIEVMSLDGTWQFRLQEEESWRYINVPGNWETQGIKTPEYGRDLKETNGVYKRIFDYRKDWSGRDVIIRLDGVQNGFTLYINGNEVGSGHSAHTMHQFNITPYIKENSSNEIELHVSSHSKYWLFDVCDAWSFTGVKGSVELFSVAREGSLSDVVFSSQVRKDNSAEITIRVKANGGHRVTATLLDERYNHVCDLQSELVENEAVMTSIISHPKLWNAETPTLYRLDVKLFDGKNKKLQSIQEKVGIREVRVEEGKVLLNNREIFLRGACLSENDAVEGSAMTAINRRRQLQQMKDANINFIRLAHYPLNPIVTRLCDEMGFYVCNEIPFASRGDHYLKNDTNVVRELNARAKSAIDRDRNNPSIIMWSLGNENKIYPCQDSVLLFTKEYDPTRLRGVPQAKGAFMSYLKRPSKYVDVICGHYINDGLLEEAVKNSELPIINTEYAHSLGTSFGELENKYEIFRREPNIAGGAVWCYQDQSVLTYNFNQQDQVLKGVRIDSLRYIDNYGLNSLPEGASERQKEGADGIVYGDGYPQEDYFELAQVYTPIYIQPSHHVEDGNVVIMVENRFDFIPLHGYTIEWRLNKWHQTLQSGSVFLGAASRQTEKICIPLSDGWQNESDLVLYMQVVRPDGSLCYERSLLLTPKSNYEELLSKAHGSQPQLLKTLIKQGFKLRVGRPIEIGLDHRRKGLWESYMLSPSNLKVRKSFRGVYNISCRWKSGTKEKNYVDGNITITTSKDGLVRVEYTLTPSDSIGGQFLDYGLTMELPLGYNEIAWLGQGPFSQSLDKTAYNNRGIWQLHKDDIRFYGNRADIDLVSIRSASEVILLYTSGKNVMFENLNGQILLTDNLVVGTYGTKFKSPEGVNANKLGQQSGCIIMKANSPMLHDAIFGLVSPINPEQPYIDYYGK